MARHINIHTHPQEALEVASSILGDGYPVAIPTETVYGLAADATNPAAITRIYETKGRPRFNPLICHMSDLEMAQRYARFDDLSLALAKAFWPGPLTIVLPLKDNSGIHPLATAGLETVGIRVPQGFAGELIKTFDRPLAAPSANSSGKISPTSASHVEDDLGEKIKLVLDAGSAGVGVESTIVKVEEDGSLRLLRPGGLASQDIERVAGKKLLRSRTASPAIEAPGMLASHYAPGASVRLQATSVDAGEALISFGDIAPLPGQDKAKTILNLSLSGDLAEAATNLFGYLKLADSSGAASIAVTAIPQHGLGEAINDRLARAAAPRS